MSTPAGPAGPWSASAPPPEPSEPPVATPATRSMAVAAPAAPATGSTGPGLLVLRVVGTLVAVLVVAGGTLGVVSRFFHQQRVETAVYTRPLTAMSIGTTTGDVRVAVGAPGSPVVVRRVLGWSFGDARSAESVTDGRLDVAAQCSGGWGFDDCSVDYDVTVPPGLALALTSHTGDIDVTGAVADLRVDDDTGDVTLRAITSASVDVSTSTGDVDLNFAAAPRSVRATSSTGDVVVQVPPGGTPYDVHVTTSTGDQSISVPVATGADRTIDVRTSTGDVEVRQVS